MDLDQLVNARQSRRSVLRKFGAVAGASLTLGGCGWIQSAVPAPTSNHKSIDHVLIVCQENHTFDNYFGRYARAGKSGIPSNFAQPDGQGGKVTPYHFSSHNRPDLAHTWQAIHSEWNDGQMNGFYTTDGREALGYYDSSDKSSYVAGYLVYHVLM